MTTFHQGQKVKFNGKTNDIENQKYAGLVGMVDFQCIEILGVPGLVYVHIKAPGQRKMRSISVHQDSLELTA